MPISHVQNSSVSTGDGTSNPITASVPSVAGGNVLVAFGSAYNPGTIGATALSDDRLNTWTRLDEKQTGGDPFNIAIFYAFGVAAGTTVVQMDANGGRYQSLVVAEFNFPLTPTVDTPVTASGTGTISTTGNTPSQADNLAVFGISWYSDDDPATPSGYTLIGEQTNFSGLTQTLGAYFQIQSSASAPTPSTSVGGGVEWASVVGTISSGSGGGGGGNPWYYFAQQQRQRVERLWTRRNWIWVPGVVPA